MFIEFRDILQLGVEVVSRRFSAVEGYHAPVSRAVSKRGERARQDETAMELIDWFIARIPPGVLRLLGPVIDRGQNRCLMFLYRNS